MHFLTVSLGYHPDVPGGAWRVAAAQATGLAARGHTVEVITAQPSEDLPLVEERGGVRITRYPQNHGHFYANWRQENRAAAELIRSRLAAAREPVLLIQHHAYLEPAVATAPAPVLHIYHGPWAEEYRYAIRTRRAGVARRCLDACIVRVMHRVEKRGLHRADRIIVLSRHFASCLRTWHGNRLRRPEIVPGGVDFTRFHPVADREETRRSWGLDPDDSLLVAIRRLDPRMGLDVLVEAFAKVHTRFPRAKLWLTGKGSAEEMLRARSESLGLGKKVRFLGFLAENDIPRLLNAADLTVMPSLDLEGFGLATAESLACGTPVVGSRAGATPELLEPLDSRLLFEAGSVDVLAERLSRYLSDRSSVPSRADCAAYARKHFSWDAQVEACEAAARELLAGGTSPSPSKGSGSVPA